MTKPRITSSTPPPTRLFPPLPDDIVAQLTGTTPEDPEPIIAPVPPPAPEPFRITLTVPRLSWRRHRRLLLACGMAAALLLVAWTVYASLLIAGVPMQAW